MQLASQSEHPSRVASQQLRRRRNSQVLLIGFSDAISESIAEQLVGLGLNRMFAANLSTVLLR